MVINRAQFILQQIWIHWAESNGPKHNPGPYPERPKRKIMELITKRARSPASK